MAPFEFVILFLSFIYTLALTHLLFAWTRMIRHRRELAFSWPHLLWMFVAFGSLANNWLGLWDLRTQKSFGLASLASLFLFAVATYFQCALVSPDFEGGETYDMRGFHEREGPTYIAASLVMGVAAIIIDVIVAMAMGVTSWSTQNWLVMPMIIPGIAALSMQRRWIQILAPAVLLAAVIAFPMIYYPVLAP